MEKNYITHDTVQKITPITNNSSMLFAMLHAKSDLVHVLYICIFFLDFQNLFCFISNFVVLQFTSKWIGFFKGL